MDLNEVVKHIIVNSTGNRWLRDNGDLIINTDSISESELTDLYLKFKANRTDTNITTRYSWYIPLKEYELSIRDYKIKTIIE